MSNTVALIPAAGSGRRMGSSENKQFLTIGKLSVLERTLIAFQNAHTINEIVVISRPEEIEVVKALAQNRGTMKLRSIVAGGEERQASIAQGLLATTDQDQWVLVHDGARPFITSDEIDQMVETVSKMNMQRSAAEAHALIMAVPSKDTIKEVQGDTVKGTLDRSRLWNVQTPQVFSRQGILEAYSQAEKKGIVGTDDASLFEAMGGTVHVFKGSYENIKITTPDDIYIGEAILRKRGEE